MANMQTECLNVKCSNEVNDGNKWCSLDCKKQFLLDNYSDGQCNLWFKDADKEFRERQKKVMKEIRDSGLSVRDFFLLMGEFKELEVINGKETD